MSKTYTTPTVVSKGTTIELTKNGGTFQVDPSGIPDDQLRQAGSVGFSL
jgi:hypothetical protein